MSTYKLSDFDYDLPESLIAQQPAQPRDSARLLIYDRAAESITDDYFYNIQQYLPDHTTLVLNNSKVEKCRLLFGNKEVFILQRHDAQTVSAMVRPGKKFKKGRKVTLSDSISADVLAIEEDGIRRLRLNRNLDDDIIDKHRYTPFPPYIEQNESLSGEYQTVFANPSGSKAAPTAGLHFTTELLEKIKNNHPVVEITLHVGLGTFAPVKTENIEEHNMHSEWFELTKASAGKLSKARHLTAVGTTSVRVLESATDAQRNFTPKKEDTNIFIRPGYQFKALDALLTNFHLPKSTLLMLVAAFTGYDEMMRIYRHAIDEEYRFYSFGDAMLLL